MEIAYARNRSLDWLLFQGSRTFDLPLFNRWQLITDRPVVNRHVALVLRSIRHKSKMLLAVTREWETRFVSNKHRYA